jgi:very-short-patch-repair endonuclease
MTEAEKKLWGSLRGGQTGCKFRRQAAVGPYVVDFATFEKRLVIEVDGGQHAEQADNDARRTAWLEGRGFRVLRFWNNEVLGEMSGVLEVVRKALDAPLPSPPRGGGGGQKGEDPRR